MFSIVRFYSFVYGILKDTFSINIRGLGFLLRSLKKDRIIELFQYKIYFSAKLSEAYARTINGKWNEPETHVFIQNITKNRTFSFIEVGANIGEVLINVSNMKNCVECWAYEPNPDAYKVITINNAINDVKNCTVLQKAVGSATGTVCINFDGHSPSVSFNSTEDPMGSIVEITTIDKDFSVLPISSQLVVMLIDVEGFELKVLEGARSFISEKQPIIIFEYHEQTKRIFTINEVFNVVGQSYDVYKVNKNAELDSDLNMSWNCVLIPKNDPVFLTS